MHTMRSVYDKKYLYIFFTFYHATQFFATSCIHIPSRGKQKFDTLAACNLLETSIDHLYNYAVNKDDPGI